jgi:4-amino-4-deoxy-L-arabinose transferase-like glycosyltransferase
MNLFPPSASKRISASARVSEMRRWVILSIIAAFVLFHLYSLFGSRLVVWDEAVYLGIGKYIYSFGAAGLWEPIRPIALPLIIGLAWKLNFPYILSASIAAFFFSLGAIYLTYKIGLRLFNAKVGVLASLLLATSPAFFYFSQLIYTEIPSVFFVLAATYFFISRRLKLAGLFAGVAVLFKFTNILLIGVFFAHLLLKFSRKQSGLAPLLRLGASFAATTLPFLIFNGFFYGDLFKPFFLAQWHQSNPAKAVAGWLGNYMFYLIGMIQQHLALIFVAGALIFWKKWFSDFGKSAAALVLLVYLAYFSFIVNKDERFFLRFCLWRAYSLRLHCLRLSAPETKLSFQPWLVWC